MTDQAALGSSPLELFFKVIQTYKYYQLKVLNNVLIPLLPKALLD